MYIKLDIKSILYHVINMGYNVLLFYIRLWISSDIIQRHYYLPRNIKYSNMHHDSISAKCEIMGLHNTYKSGNFSYHIQRHLFEMEGKGMHLLLMEEERWILKSQVIWLEHGNLNIKFFHQYANDRRVQYSIWEIKRDDGVMVRDYEEIEAKALKWLKNFIIFIQILGLRPLQTKWRLYNIFPNIFLHKRVLWIII